MATEGLNQWSEILSRPTMVFHFSAKYNRNGVSYMERTHNKNSVPLAKDLRKNMTKEEKHLWYDYLKPYSQAFGIRFTRQKVIGNYIVDF